MADPAELPYIGKELDIFALADNWKRYVKAGIEKCLTGDVLEVGAGIGATTVALHRGNERRWVCLEPDVVLAARLRARVSRSSCASNTSIIAGSIRAFTKAPCFDCILYIDVLEHIDDDRGQIEDASQLVRAGGSIVVLAPAHRWLFSEFDRSIGHLRRYCKATLRLLMPQGWIEERLTYLDSIGVLLSLANALALRQAMPTTSQIMLWDRFCVPFSRHIDYATRGLFGKSILAIWRKPRSPEKTTTA